jgi:hypothetical protein
MMVWAAKGTLAATIGKREAGERPSMVPRITYISDFAGPFCEMLVAKRQLSSSQVA